MLIRPQSPFDEAYSGFDFPPGSTLVAAVSGGSDSVAMLVSLRDYLAVARPDVSLVAATIDHGLRPQSASEAARVRQLCDALGIRHVSRKWLADKPAAGIQAAARAARYLMLCDIADDVGAAAIVTGHTADDQAETIAMRAQRGAGRGLAGMAPAALLNGQVWLLRPLLGQRRETLRQYLESRQIGWVDDPTNDDARYERPRIRRELADRPDISEWLALGRQTAGKRELLGAAAASLIKNFVSRPAPGLFHIALDLVAQTDQDAAAYALRILLAVAGGVSHLPDDDRTRSLLALNGDPGPSRQTLSRSVIDRRKAAIFVYRENRDLPQWARLQSDRDWDGRYRIETNGESHAALLGPLGRSRTEPEPISDVPMSILRAAQGAEPALIFPGGHPQLLSPANHGTRAWPVAAPWSQLLPSFDLAPARAIASLLGAAIPPDSPYRGHSEGQA